MPVEKFLLALFLCDATGNKIKKAPKNFRIVRKAGCFKSCEGL